MAVIFNGGYVTSGMSMVMAMTMTSHFDAWSVGGSVPFTELHGIVLWF